MNPQTHKAVPQHVSQTAIWRALQTQAQQVPGLRALFAADAQRFTQFSASACGLLLDYSKQRIDTATRNALLTLAQHCELEAKRDAMLRGEPINRTEQRAVLHTALRLPAGKTLLLDGQDVAAQAASVRTRIRAFSDKVRTGAWLGFSGPNRGGQRIRHVVNIGIGGSDLGPQMIQLALSPYAHEALSFHFVSNVDGRHLADVLRAIDARNEAGNTLFIIASKTFTTLETMMNAASARAWMLAHGCPENALAQHFVAVSTNVPAAQAFGIAADNVFPFWDWVGGRYSAWSAIGLAVVLSIGADRFDALLAGAHAMDTHFAQAPLAQNLPVLMALVGVWNVNFLGCGALSIAPYHQRLARFAAYLQQMEMESNGKRVTLDGHALDYATCPVIFGEPGTNGQHAYFQLLHQGVDIVPVDFIAVARDDSGLAGHNEALLANCLAQSKALAFGKTTDEVLAEMPADKAWLAPHRTFPGDRPSSTLLLDELTPHTLGALIALYEHKVFVQSAIWNVNAYDQWGVELGKVLAKEITPLLAPGAALPVSLDHSTAGLIRQIKTANR